ncbi:putative HipA-like protein [Arcticibacter svalbardensis MN12-7]|uniref:Putative HipA-like protein n=1 Tax=Arcticibacter svalbardensis MN12-7 TaxID=1150600 RepID=R9GSI7_9SPHI|nr:HipA N-terminal domain-containing protein [Arcticibacter svalbardensis]EOR94525.1 putative HipA-like protein [Arcticibacter svalbardensis MN12-7]
MRKAKVLFRDEEAGVLTQHDDSSFTFRYHDAWMADNDKPAISLTLPKSEQEYNSKILFPFFYNMLPEGSNKQVACKLNRIDLNDYFGLLMTTARHDSIGAIRVVKIETK